MKLEKLEQAALRAQEELKSVEAKVTVLAKRAEEATGEAREAKQVYKNARKLARVARKLFVQAEEQLQEQRQGVAKAQKRLAKALKRLVTEEATTVSVLLPGTVTAGRPIGARNSGRRGKRSPVRRGTAHAF